MIKFEMKAFSPREKELFLGNLVTWGSLISAVVLGIAFAPLSTAENDHDAPASRAEAVSLDMQGNQG